MHRKHEKLFGCLLPKILMLKLYFHIHKHTLALNQDHNGSKKGIKNPEGEKSTCISLVEHFCFTITWRHFKQKLYFTCKGLVRAYRL